MAFLTCVFGFAAEASFLAGGDAASTFGSADGTAFTAAMGFCEAFLVNFNRSLGRFLCESFSGLRTSEHDYNLKREESIK